MKTELALDPNTNIDFICKLRQEINSMFDKRGDEYKEAIQGMSKNIIKSKYFDIIDDIKIYWNLEESELFT